MVPGGRGWGESPNVFFLTWMHFVRHGLPMELPSDSQEHCYMILPTFGHKFGRLFAKKTKWISEKRSNKMTEKHVARATDDNSFHDEASCHALAKIKSWNPCAVAGLGEALWIVSNILFWIILIYWKSAILKMLERVGQHSENNLLVGPKQLALTIESYLVESQSNLWDPEAFCKIKNLRNS